MQKLKSQRFCHLSEGVLKLLNQNRISTILDFIQEDVTKLATITKLNLPEILAIRNAIFAKYSAPLHNGTMLIEKVLKNRKNLNTGIESIDNIIGGGVPIGYITEICGLADSGKTQLSFQLAINCVKNRHDRTVLYVDTKGDFSAVRIQKILMGQSCSYKEMSVIMHKIRVIHIWTMHELVSLLKDVKNKTLGIENLSLIIVDSLPCLMLQHLGDENKIGLSYLNTIVNYSRFIGNELDVAIIYINIQTRWIDPDICDMEANEEPTSAFKESAYNEKRSRCLGKYWEQIPGIILQLEKIEDVSKDTNDFISIKVSVLRCSNINNLGKECIVNIKTNGVM